MKNTQFCRAKHLVNRTWPNGQTWIDRVRIDFYRSTIFTLGSQKRDNQRYIVSFNKRFLCLTERYPSTGDEIGHRRVVKKVYNEFERRFNDIQKFKKTNNIENIST